LRESTELGVDDNNNGVVDGVMQMAMGCIRFGDSNDAASETHELQRLKFDAGLGGLAILDF